MLQIKINNDKQYRAFIQYATTTCDSFSLVFEIDAIDKSIFQGVYYTIKEFVTKKKLIGYHPDTGTLFQSSVMNYFKCNKRTRAYLQAANGVYDWDGGNLPEELCFYRNGQRWFCCVCHEKYSFIYNETKEDILFFSKAGINFFGTR